MLSIPDSEAYWQTPSELRERSKLRLKFFIHCHGRSHVTALSESLRGSSLTGSAYFDLKSQIQISMGWLF